jgi:hypothetical protein
MSAFLSSVSRSSEVSPKSLSRLSPWVLSRESPLNQLSVLPILLGYHAWASWASTLTDWLGPLGFPRWLTGLGLLGSHADWLWLGLLGLPRLGLLGFHADWLTWASWAPALTDSDLGLLGYHAWASWAFTLTDWLGPLGIPRWLTLTVEIYPLK